MWSSLFPFSIPDTFVQESFSALCLSTSSPLVFLSAAKATFDAISKTYSYLTPDLWKETVFTKSPYQVCQMRLQSFVLLR